MRVSTSLQGFPAGFGHQATGFKVSASFFVELFHDDEIGECVGLGSLRPVASHPATFL